MFRVYMGFKVWEYHLSTNAVRRQYYPVWKLKIYYTEITPKSHRFYYIYTYPSLKYFLPTKRVVPTIHRPRVKIHQRRINIVEVCGCQRQLLCELYIFLEINSKCFLYKWGGEYFFNWIRNNTFKLQRMNLKRSWQQGQSTLYSTP